MKLLGHSTLIFIVTGEGLLQGGHSFPNASSLPGLWGELISMSSEKLSGKQLQRLVAGSGVASSEVVRLEELWWALTVLLRP